MSEPGRWAKLAAARSEVVGTCWLWTGAVDSQGYARVRDRNRTDRLHHLLCKETHPTERRWVARHLCGCKLCVNPEHIAPGNKAQNKADDREHAASAVNLPGLDEVRALAATLPDLDGEKLAPAELRDQERRDRLPIDQTMRGGDGVAEAWFRDMAGAAGQGELAKADADTVLMLSLIARKKRQMGKRPLTTVPAS